MGKNPLSAGKLQYHKHQFKKNQYSYVNVFSTTSQLLVEGGGSYYHLNHSELVSLLLHRDAELQQEREEYERRGLLLEKREMELKKMRVLIRDLEDYIDTLLVRIMEQTPALLQVRSKMK